MSAPVSVGLVGAGYWAATQHGPLHAAPGPTRLEAVWARDPVNAARLAQSLGAAVAGSFDELVERCELIDFAVSPNAQAELAPAAARAGRAIALEKPLGLSSAQAETVHRAVEAANVPNLVAFTKRYHPRTRAFLDAARAGSAAFSGGQALYVHGGLLDDGFLTQDAGWRAGHRGIVLDLGAHLLDLLDASVGPIVAVRCDTSDRDYTALTCRHRDGAVTQAALSGRVGVPRAATTIDLFSSDGSTRFTSDGMDHSLCWDTMRAEIASAIREGTPVTVDTRRALAVQQILEAALRSLSSGDWESVSSA